MDSITIKDRLATPRSQQGTGPGKVLCGLLKQIDGELKSLNFEDAASLEKTLAELKDGA